jgi:hypothetical protein
MIRKWLACWVAGTLLFSSVPVSGEGIQALVGKGGRVQLNRGREKIAEFGAGVYNLQWVSADASADLRQDDSESKRHLQIRVPGGGQLSGWAELAGRQGGLDARYVMTPDRDLALNSLQVSTEFAIPVLAGGRWVADGRSGEFPQEFGEVTVFSGSIRELTVELPAGGTLRWAFPEPTRVLLQDNRQWGPSFSVRIFRSSTPQQPFAKGVPISIAFTLAAEGGVSVEHDAPVTIVAGPDWIPLRLELDIQPGSALDFSTLGLQDAPAGKHGWVRADRDGTFYFERQPGKPVRFYGVNFCFSAHYIPHEQSDRLADRLVRLGYNSVRLHHHERELTEPDEGRTRLNREKLDQLDYLVAACIRRGIYVTTDLFVSRPVDVAPFLPPGVDARSDAMNRFKVLAALNPAAFENWKTFSRNWLEHVNPYTGRAYKDEPGVAWLALINEGNLTNFVHLAKDIPDYQQAWNRWLLEQYGGRAALAEAWGAVLGGDQDPSRGTVPLDGSVYGQDRRSRDLILFLTRVEQDFLARAMSFLRDELGVKALVTNMNGWTNHVVSQRVRAGMDYVDDHFYVDHPRFLEQSWRLPSRCDNASPVAGGASGGRHLAFTRLLDKPFTVSEYNYSGPGRYRGVGGILTGALGAIQGWDAIWRFAYSHSRDNLFQPGRMDYFNMASDPLSQAAERAIICLFLRQDMRPAPHSLGIVMTDADLDASPAQIPRLAPDWHWAAWITRVGTWVTDDALGTLPCDVVLPLGWAASDGQFTGSKVARVGDPYATGRDELIELLRRRNILTDGNPTDPGRNIYQSETGEITIEAPQDRMTLDTPRTAGGFAPAGQSIHTAHGVRITVQDTDATVWVSALDDQPITTSGRLLVTHLTDLQNTGIRYAERARQTLLDWGQLPHLVRAGKAEVRIRLPDPAAYRVWALSTSGQRVASVASDVQDDELVFLADVAALADHGAVLTYEIVADESATMPK